MTGEEGHLIVADAFGHNAPSPTLRVFTLDPDSITMLIFSWLRMSPLSIGQIAIEMQARAAKRAAVILMIASCGCSS